METVEPKKFSTNHLSHNCCLPASALAENWSQDPEASIELRHSEMAWRHLNHWARNRTWLLVLAWFSLGSYGHLGSKAVDGRSTLHPSEFQINKQTTKQIESTVSIMLPSMFKKCFCITNISQRKNKTGLTITASGRVRGKLHSLPQPFTLCHTQA